jgi:hypothetical protein
MLSSIYAVLRGPQSSSEGQCMSRDLTPNPNTGTVLTERRTFAVPDDGTPGSVETCSKETVSRLCLLFSA